MTEAEWTLCESRCVRPRHGWPGGPGGEPGCEVELTEIRTGGQDWWTLGFEAARPAGLLRSALAAAAALVFAQALPGGMQPGPDQSMSYAQWLGRAPGVDADNLRTVPLPGDDFPGSAEHEQRDCGGREEAGRAPGHHKPNTTLKSFCMLTIVQPRSFALARAFSEPAS
jgi:hypothetical protein